LPSGMSLGFVLRLQPSEIVAIAGYRRQRIFAAEVVIKGEEFAQQDRRRPTVQHQVVIGDQQAMLLLSELEHSETNQRRLVNSKPGSPQLGGNGLGALRLLHRSRSLKSSHCQGKGG